MNRLVLALAVLLLAIQWPLWAGHGGWLRAWDLQRQLEARQALNAGLRARNQALLAEIASLRQGSEAIEERARRELHMVRNGETFFQYTAPAPAGTPAGDSVATLGKTLQLGVE
jgi:cell division protein FtsB